MATPASRYPRMGEAPIFSVTYPATSAAEKAAARVAIRWSSCIWSVPVRGVGPPVGARQDASASLRRPARTTGRPLSGGARSSGRQRDGRAAAETAQHLSEVLGGGLRRSMPPWRRGLRRMPEAGLAGPAARGIFVRIRREWLDLARTWRQDARRRRRRRDVDGVRSAVTELEGALGVLRALDFIGQCLS